MFKIIGKHHFASKWHDMFLSQYNKYYCKWTLYYVERCHVLGENVHSKFSSGCKSNSMDGVVLYHLKKVKQSIILVAQFHSNLSDESNQDISTIVTNLYIILHLIIYKVFTD